MPEIQITETAIIVIAICITIICGLLIFKTKDGLKVRIDKSGVNLDLADDDNVNKKPEEKELENETDIA
ncbi:MAG: hypothetical protein LBK82_14010 [Planctomycetaceae bacterium]|jgi:hypothetical protein|nr:hypothetical protein [Planctomycetaceae bacterium]